MRVSRGFWFIHGFYASMSILNILKGSLQLKLKGANVWPFNACNKVATDWVCHIWSLYRYCKKKIDQNQLQWYLEQFLRAPAGPVFRLDFASNTIYKLQLQLFRVLFRNTCLFVCVCSCSNCNCCVLGWLSSNREHDSLLSASPFSISP